MTVLGGGLIVFPGAGIPGPPGPAGPGFFTFGANAISSTTSNRFLFPGYVDNLAPLITIQYRVPVDCTIDKMYVYQNQPGGNGLASIYNLRVNGLPTLLNVSIASTALTASDLVNSAVVLEGDLLDVIITKAASIGATPNNVVVSMRVTP